MTKQVRKLSVILSLLACVSYGTMAQGRKGRVAECAPIVDGVVCYQDERSVPDKSYTTIFTAIQKWAKEEYGKELFISSVKSDSDKGTIVISSRVELLLSDTEKTLLTYKAYISCRQHKYTIDVKDLVFLYDPFQKHKYKKYPAEKILSNNGKNNPVWQIEDATLFCNATFFFMEELFTEVNNAVWQDELK